MAASENIEFTWESVKAIGAAISERFDLLGKYAPHLSRQAKDKLIEEFKQNVLLLRKALRDEE